MTRFIFVSLLALLLAACSSTPDRAAAIIAAAQLEPIESYAVATLAPIGSFEWQAAPAYTKLAMMRHNAAKALRKGEISVEDAIEVQNAADAIRAVLDAAVNDDVAGRREDATRKLLKAGLQLVAAETLINQAGGGQ